VADQILRFLEVGAFVGSAARASGIAPSTIYRWLSRDAAFRERLEQAEAEGAALMAERVLRAPAPVDFDPDGTHDPWRQC
jgi:hypothetical protein